MVAIRLLHVEHQTFGEPIVINFVPRVRNGIL
jgi:hypothetical protein